jgi:hypothetical protein
MVRKCDCVFAPQQIIILNIDGSAQEITIEEMKTIILQQSTANINNSGDVKREKVCAEDITSKANNKAESASIDEVTVSGVQVHLYKKPKRFSNV